MAPPVESAALGSHRHETVGVPRAPVEAASYVPALDGVRGIAILSVMLHHGDGLLVPGGFLGVDVFFVLSGYLITRILIGEARATGRVRLGRFYVRRALRLLPALVVLLGAVLAFSAAFLGPYLFRQNLRAAAFALFYTMNWARAFQWHPWGILMHTWSLSIEEQFYILWPAALLLLLRRAIPVRGIARVALLLAAASTAARVLFVVGGARLERVYNGLDLHASGLLLGCALAALEAADLWRSFARDPVRGRWLRLLGGLSLPGLVCLFLVAQWTEPSSSIWAVTLVEALTGVMIVSEAMPGGGSLRALLGWGPLAYTGRISYGLYLWHFPVDFILASASLGPGAVLALGLPLAYAAASLSFFFVERPFLRLKERFGARGKPA